MGAGNEPRPGTLPAKEARDLNDGAASAFAESLGPAPKKRARSSKKGLEVALADLARVFPGGAPADGFAPRHLVALYAKLHESVYGARPEELVDGKSFFAATSAAEKLVRVDFAGDMDAALDFLRWAWRREQRREPTRREQGGGSRIGWRFQFAARVLLTDYRVDLGRRGPRRVSSHR